MCGIFALVQDYIQNDEHPNFNDCKNIIANVYKNLNHRGPDSQGNNVIVDRYLDKSILMAHTRLKINGDDTTQPLINDDNTAYLIINGEIFNWKELQDELNYTCKKSDCEIIFPLYEKYKDNLPSFFKKLKGQFSFFLYDLTNKHVLIGRDPIGITPLYIGTKLVNDNGQIINRIAVSSELKCLTELYSDNSFVDSIKIFYPRKYVYAPLDKLYEYNDFTYEYLNYYDIVANTYDPIQRNSILESIRDKLTESVRLRLQDLINDNVEFGVLLSGGLDSSLIASLVVSLAKEMGMQNKIKTFSIGVNNSVPDLVAARIVSEFLDTDHHEYNFTIEEGLNNIENVIWYTETYDCTTIRASTAMYLLTSKIKAQYNGMKVLFSGELSDELLCYLYGANAPNEVEYQLETINLVSNVHSFDCLRANKTCMANSMEVRVPFTDDEFVKYILSLNPKWKNFGKNSFNDMEKQILRDAFEGYIPKSILYRKKEQFSDGVSGFNGKKDNLIDALKHFTNKKYSDLDFNTLKMTYTYNRPDTKEKLYYRQIFCKLFNYTSYKNTSEFTVKYWEPKWSKTNDPSGRVQTFWSHN
jgi:asparagine synthase (glutamine-hydrolysing)